MFKDKIISDEYWLKYLNSRLNKEFINKKEKEDLNNFVSNKKYKDIVNKIYNNTYSFSIPKKHIISKNHSSKKRIVYTYTYEEMHILKYITYLLYEYDYLFSRNLYSFRKNRSVKEAVKNISRIKNLNNMYGYKVDIKNYFNSINKDILLDNLKKDIPDKDLINLFTDILSNDEVIFKDKIIKEDKGAIAGNPLSSFFSNYYLNEIDHYFENEKVFYIRYADDILILSNNKDDLKKYKNIVYDFINKYKLSINKDKEYFFEKNDTFEFLGFSFDNKTIDLSKNTVLKIKGKIKRSSRGIRRWMLRKSAKEDSTLKAMNRKYNRKFYGNDINKELSWIGWFFPSINTTKSLKIIDKYYQDRLRYIVTGKYNKKNYKIVPYERLKKCNYRSLVNEYYKFKSM